MGLVSTILTLPLAPVRAVVWLGEVIQERVDQQLNDPAVVRRQLEELDEARRRGELSQDGQAEAEARILARLTTPSPTTSTPDVERE
jgi:cytochrome c-type biogenesis protein CcmH/NrfG